MPKSYSLKFAFVGWGLLLLTFVALADDPTRDFIAEENTPSSQVICRDLTSNSICYLEEPAEISFIDASEDISFSAPDDRIPINSVSKVQTLASNGETDTSGKLIISLKFGSRQPTILGLLSGEASLENINPLEAGPAFQNLRFRNESETSSSGAIQGRFALWLPEESTISLTLNGANLTLDSTWVLFQFLSPNSLAATVVRGELRVQDGATVQPGETLVAVTDNEGTVVFWSAPRAVNATEQQTFEQVAAITDQIHGDAVTVDVTCSERQHVVAEGESLSTITVQYAITLEALLAANRDIGAVIYIGQELVIPCGESEFAASPTADAPPPVTPVTTEEAHDEPTCETTTSYVVQSGDTLYGIAIYYGTTVEAIQAANQLVGYIIYIGQVLVIPCGSQTTYP